jgi:hypothetical protein
MLRVDSGQHSIEPERPEALDDAKIEALFASAIYWGGGRKEKAFP